MLELLRDIERRLRNLEVLASNILKIGKVVNRYPDKGTVRVEFEKASEEDKTISYELSVLQPKTLKDKFYYMPEEGEYVLCVFLPYAPDIGFVIGAYYNSVIPTPISDNNKWHKTFEDGTILEYDKKSHKLTAIVNGDIEITANNTTITTITTHNGNVTINGDLFVDGNITASQNVADLGGTKGSLAALRDVYNSHTHPGDSGGDTGTPNQTVGA